MTQRDELYRKFGPILLEAVARAMVKELNKIRRELGMPEISLQEAIDAIENELTKLQPYDWMGDEP